MNEDIVHAHRRELVTGRYPLYGLLDLVDRAALDREVRDRTLSEAARLIDTLIFYEMHTRIEEVFHTAEAILRQPPDVIPAAFASWRNTLEAATHSRRALRAVTGRFGDWIATSSPAALRDTLSLLPTVCGVSGPLKEPDILQIVQRLSALPSDEQRAATTAALKAYAGGTTGEVLMACSRLAAYAARAERTAQLARLLAAIPVDAMEESLDAERLLPAIDDLCAQCATIDDAAWTAAFDLSLVLALHNHASAWKAARRLRKRVTRLRSDTTCRYLEDVRSLVDAVGIGILGFALRRLPSYYATYDPAQVRRFVHAATAIAAAAGVNAARLFVETRTATARALLAQAPPIA